MPEICRRTVLVAALALAGAVAPAAGAATLGELTPLNCFSTTAVTGCTSQPGFDGAIGLSDSVAVSPDGRSVYAAMSKSTLVELAVQPGGSLAYVTCIGDASLAGSNPCPVAAPGIEQGGGGGGDVVVSPDGAHVYVTGYASDTIAVFRRDTGGPTLGHLTSEGCVANAGLATCDAVPGTTHTRAAALDGPNSVAISPDGADVYVTSGTSKAIAVLKRDTAGPAAGRLAGDGCLADISTALCDAVAGSTHDRARGLALPDGLAISADGASVYASDATGAVAALTRDTGGATLGRLASDGCLADDSLPNCDATPGSTKGRAPGLSNPQDAVLSPDGKSLYVAGQGMVAVFKRDAGGATPGRIVSDGCLAVAGSAECDGVAGSTSGRSPAVSSREAVVSPDSRNVYTADFGGSMVGVFRRGADGGLAFDGCRANTGTTTCDNVAGSTRGQAPGLKNVAGLGLAPDGRSLWAASENPGAVVAFARFVPPPPAPPEAAPPAVTAAAVPPAPPAALPLPLRPAFLGVRLGAKTVRIDAKGRGTLPISCPAAALGGCTGTGVVSSARKIVLRARRTRKIQRFASFRVARVAPGATRRVAFRLSRKSLRLLRRQRSLRSVVAVTAADARNVKRATKRTVTLKLRRR